MIRQVEFILRKSVFLFALISIVLYSSQALADTQTVYPFKSITQQKRFESIINQTRCLVCKNQTIAESHTTLAKDLRQKIFELIHQGATDQEIKDFLVKRYGDFILFDPLLKPTTLLLWIMPAFILLLALFFLFYILYRRQNKFK